MTQPHLHVDNPFALLMDPQSIFRAIENSERLERLHSRVCRPLDKPLLPMTAAEDVESFERSIDVDGDDMIFDDLPGEEI